MITVKVIFTVIISAVLSMVVRRHKPEFAPLVIVAAGAVVWSMLYNSADSSLEAVKTLLEGTSVNIGYISILIKTLGICILTQIAADICRDCGESALATRAEIAGKFVILSISMPMITSVAQMAIELINR